jgi:hypothetical protein
VIILFLREGKEDLNITSVLDELESQVLAFSQETQLNAFVESARKAEFKGQKKKAIDQYQEALFFL